MNIEPISIYHGAMELAKVLVIVIYAGWKIPLIKSGKFSLPGRKTLVKNDSKYEVVLIDVTETPIERPQKNKDSFIPVRRSDIH